MASIVPHASDLAADEQVCLPVAHQSHMCDSVPNLRALCYFSMRQCAFLSRLFACVIRNVNQLLMRFLSCYTFGSHMRKRGLSSYSPVG